METAPAAILAAAKAAAAATAAQQRPVKTQAPWDLEEIQAKSMLQQSVATAAG